MRRSSALAKPKSWSASSRTCRCVSSVTSSAPSALRERARGREQPVADAADVEHEPVRVERDGPPAQPRDHRRPPASASSGDASAWQIATASASAA